MNDGVSIIPGHLNIVLSDPAPVEQSVQWGSPLQAADPQPVPLGVHTVLTQKWLLSCLPPPYLLTISPLASSLNLNLLLFTRVMAPLLSQNCRPTHLNSPQLWDLHQQTSSTASGSIDYLPYMFWIIIYLSTSFVWDKLRAKLVELTLYFSLFVLKLFVI